MSLLAVLLLLAGLSWHDQQVAARYDDPFLSWERSTAAAETWKVRIGESEIYAGFGGLA